MLITTIVLRLQKSLHLRVLYCHRCTIIKWASQPKLHESSERTWQLVERKMMMEEVWSLAATLFHTFFLLLVVQWMWRDLRQSSMIIPVVFIFFYSSLPYNETLFSFFINFFAPLARSELKCSSQCIQWGDGRGVARRREENNIKKPKRESRGGENKMQKRQGQGSARWTCNSDDKSCFFPARLRSLFLLATTLHFYLLVSFSVVFLVPFCVAFSVVCRLFNPFVLLHCV